MARITKNLTPQQIVLESCETPKQYHEKILIAKQNNSDWAKDIPPDHSNERAYHGKCLICGNPDMENSISGAECKRCGIKRLSTVYGYKTEVAEKIYEERQKQKENGVKFAEMLRKKRFGKTETITEVDDLPF